MIIDTEFLGMDRESGNIHPDAVVFAVAAIGSQGQERIWLLDVDSQIERGGVISQDTLFWWLEQGAPWMKDRVAVQVEGMLKELAALYDDGDAVWMRGTDCDITILRSLGRRFGMGKWEPWPFWTPACVRSVQKFLGVSKQSKSHDPLQDCRDDLALLDSMRELVRPIS